MCQNSEAEINLNMKSLLIVSFVFLLSLSGMAQKVSVGVIHSKNSSLSDWQILDQNDVLVYSGSETLQEDSVLFSLDANTLYILKITLSKVSNPDTGILTLTLNGQPLLYIKSDSVTGDHLYPFFTGVRGLNAKITGGTGTVISDFPWQVYYISGNFRCGGSIINNKWVLTAAHCTKDNSNVSIPASQMFVKVGVNNPANTLEGKTYAVTEVIVNEGFNDQTLLNDIALLHIKDSINFTNAKPIKLVSADDVKEGAILPGVMAWVTGWGYTHVNPNVVPTALQKVQLPIITNAQAATVWGAIPASDLMAGFLNGNKDACNGDSGGPLVVPVLDEYKLAGIVSWGSGDCNTYGAYTRVSDFLSWIQTKTGITTLFKPPKPVGDSIICHGTSTTQYSVTPVAGASSYEWKVLPTSAGVISGNTQAASLVWNPGYLGSVNIIMRVTVNGNVSDWSRLDGNVVLNTRLLTQSRDTILCAGNPITLKLGAEGYNLEYTWYKNDQVVQKSTSPNLGFSATTAQNSGVYRSQISGSCGTVSSNALDLTVYPVTHVTKLSPDIEVPFNGAVNLSVTAEGHDLVYQWQKDGTVIENTNSDVLSLQNMNASDIGLYKVNVSGTCGTELSDTIYVYVKKSDTQSDPQVFIWPSLTSGNFSVALNNDDTYNIRIYSTTGIKVKEQLNCRFQTGIYIGTLASGVYIVEVYNKDFRRSVKVIKE
jgi:secreted trypsin-like serine protease